MALTKARLIEDNAIKAVHIDETATGITLADLTVTGALNANSGVTGNITGTVLTAAQPNITSVGTLTGLSLNSELQINGSSNISTIKTDSDNSLIALIASPELIDNKPRIQIIGTTFASDPNTIQYLGGQHIFKSSAAATEYVRIDSSGRLGIGTNSPIASLDVFGSIITRNSTGGGAIGIGTIAGRGQYQYLNFGGATGGTDYGWQIGRSPNAGGIINDGFYIYDIKTNNSPFNIALGGNVGIGTTGPYAKLTVYGGVANPPSAGGTPNVVGIPGYFETRSYGFGCTTSFTTFFTVDGTNLTYLIVYRIGQSDLTSVPNGMIMVFKSPGLGISYISGSSSYIQASGNDLQIRSAFGSYGTAVTMQITRLG